MCDVCERGTLLYWVSRRHPNEIQWKWPQEILANKKGPKCMDPKLGIKLIPKMESTGPGGTRY